MTASYLSPATAIDGYSVKQSSRKSSKEPSLIVPASFSFRAPDNNDGLPKLMGKDRALVMATFFIMGTASLITWNGVLNTLAEFNNAYDTKMNETTTATLMSTTLLSTVVWIVIGSRRPCLIYIGGVTSASICLLMCLVFQFAQGHTGIVLMHVACSFLGLAAMGTLQPVSFSMAGIMPENMVGMVSTGMGFSGIFTFVVWLLLDKLFITPAANALDDAKMIADLSHLQQLTDDLVSSRKISVWIFFSLLAILCLSGTIMFWYTANRVAWVRDALKGETVAVDGEKGGGDQAGVEVVVGQHGGSRRVSYERRRRSSVYDTNNGDGSMEGAGAEYKSKDAVTMVSMRTWNVSVVDNTEADVYQTETQVKTVGGGNNGVHHTDTVDNLHTNNGKWSQFCVALTYYWWVFRQSMLPVCSVFLCFFVTLSLFPNVGPLEWGNEVVVVIGMFQLGDFLGRFLPSAQCYLGSLVVWPKNVVFLVSIGRILFVPLYMCCDRFGYTSEEPMSIFSALWFHIILTLCLAVSNGWLASLSMMYAPNCLEKDEDKGRASSIATLSLLIAIMSGLWFSAVYLL
eukprot:GHVQ01029455.1.p1 GENE.GHVQ01029455.1~~GHVQ01029455.1.p1  ORF type:complete len:571 (+),score=79.03 GHVQ01029455.1:436-2148(+)